MTEEADTKETADAFKARVASCIKTWRESEPILSREELAVYIGRSMATVQRWERDGDPRLSEVNLMEQIKSGLLHLIFPRFFAPTVRKIRRVRKFAHEHT